jgi:hypothetical protein
MRRRSLQEIWSQVKSWLRRWWKFLLMMTIIFAVGQFLVQVSKLYRSIAVSREPVLKSLIEAEATILGFFGLIVIYALTSYDRRMDRFEEQIFELAEKRKQEEVPKELPNRGVAKSKGELLVQALGNIQENKRELVSTALLVGSLLVLSLLLSILALGMGDTAEANMLCELAFYLFFIGIVSNFAIFYLFLRKTPESYLGIDLQS